MNRVPALVGSVFLCFAASPGVRAGDPKFTLGFEGYPAVLRGEAGETKKFELFVTLATEGLSPPEGVQGWSLSTVVEGDGVKSYTPVLKGHQVSTIFDHDGDPATPLLDPYELDLYLAGFKVPHIGFNDPRSWDPRLHGASATVVLHQTQRMVLRPETQRILKINVEVVLPREPGCASLEFRFEDGGGYNGNIRNNIVARGVLFRPETTFASVLLCTPPHFRRGDSNADGRADISDPITTLGFLFQGGPTPGCLDALDVDNDGAVDLSDPIFFLGDFFISPYPWSFIPSPGLFHCGGDPVKETDDPLTCESFPPCD